jgi:hypothetical protein
MPETCRAVFKRQVTNLRICCIWLVDSFESMMMHGLANPEFKKLVLLYVMYPRRTLGTSWCLLLKKNLITKHNRITPSKVPVSLLTCVSQHFIGVERNIGLTENTLN